MTRPEDLTREQLVALAAACIRQAAADSDMTTALTDVYRELLTPAPRVEGKSELDYLSAEHDRASRLSLESFDAYMAVSAETRTRWNAWEAEANNRPNWRGSF